MLVSRLEAIACRLEAIASRLEAIACRLEAIASRLEAIASRLEAIASRLEAIASRLEAIACRLEAIASRFASRLEAIACRLEAIASLPLSFWLMEFSSSTEVIERMDELHGVSKEITSSLLDFCGNTELKLDLQVLYLRRVHHFCFYSGKWCRDEWTLRILCGAATVREPYRQDDTDMEIWAIGHEGRIKDRGQGKPWAN